MLRRVCFTSIATLITAAIIGWAAFLTDRAMVNRDGVIELKTQYSLIMTYLQRIDGKLEEHMKEGR